MRILQIKNTHICWCTLMIGWVKVYEDNEGDYWRDAARFPDGFGRTKFNMVQISVNSFKELLRDTEEKLKRSGKGHDIE